MENPSPPFKGNWATQGTRSFEIRYATNLKRRGIAFRSGQLAMRMPVWARGDSHGGIRKPVRRRDNLPQSGLVGQVLSLRRRQRMVQIGDALAEDRTTRVNVEIGTGQTVLRPGTLVGTFGGISDADCESWCTGLKAVPRTCTTVRRNEPRIIPFGQASLETSDAGITAALRWIESQDDGAGMLFLRRSRWVFRCIGKGVARGQQRDNGRIDDFGGMRRPTGGWDGGIAQLRWGNLFARQTKRFAPNLTSPIRPCVPRFSQSK